MRQRHGEGVPALRISRCAVTAYPSHHMNPGIASDSYVGNARSLPSKPSHAPRLLQPAASAPDRSGCAYRVAAKRASPTLSIVSSSNGAVATQLTISRRLASGSARESRGSGAGRESIIASAHTRSRLSAHSPSASSSRSTATATVVSVAVTA